MTSSTRVMPSAMKSIGGVAGEEVSVAGMRKNARSAGGESGRL
jgi:hypothetical protein